MALLESGEMYLETILILSGRISPVRAIDVCDYIGYSKPSVSRAMRLLRTGGYILVDTNGAITLTDSGRAIAERIYERHQTLTTLLVGLGVDEKTATEDACKMEHYLSDETYAAFKEHAKLYGSKQYDYSEKSND